MTDIVDRAIRSRMMSGIRGKDTKPEKLVRSKLHGLGFRFRLHAKDLPGKPDLVLPKHRVALFVNGCFWHAHGCAQFRWPSSNAGFWKEKLTSNRLRDQNHLSALEKAGWRTCVVWECAVRGPEAIGISSIGVRIADWILHKRKGRSDRWLAQAISSRHSR